MSWQGAERRASDYDRAVLKQDVSEAVKEALKGINLIDGPTHIAHHQELERILSLKDHAQRVGVGVIITGVIGLIVIGFGAWVKSLFAGR